VLPSPLIERLIERDMRSAAAIARNKFSPNTFLMSRSL
jgi:hypothetical protein